MDYWIIRIMDYFKKILNYLYNFCVITLFTGTVFATNYLKVTDNYSLLPAGSVRPLGWIKQHIFEDATNGWASNVEEMSLDGDWWDCFQPTHNYGHTNFYMPYVERQCSHAAGEYQAHWVDLMSRLGYVAGIEFSSNIIDKAVNAILENLPADGYLGTTSTNNQFKNNLAEYSAELELWSYGEHINAFLQYYRLTGNERVFAECTNAANLFCDTFGPTSTNNRPMFGIWWGSPVPALSKLFELTGNKRYLTNAVYIMHEYLKKYGWDLENVKTNYWLTGHTAGIIIGMQGVLEIYKTTGDTNLLELLNLVEQKVELQHLLQNGSPSGHGENLYGKGPYHHMELCDPFWWVWHWSRMFKLTGDSHYADLAEKAALNAMPGARSKDGKAAAYFTCQNQLTACHYDHHMKYAIRQTWDCCHSNGPRILPIFLENMILLSKTGELSIIHYGPMKANFSIAGAKVNLIQETSYPFDENISIIFTTDVAVTFPVKLRIPGWCKSPVFKVNDLQIPETSISGSWATIEREWSSGDKIDITFPMEINLTFSTVRGDPRYYIPDEEKMGTVAEAVVVNRGPLLFSLPVAAYRHTNLKTMGTHRGAFEEFASPNGNWNYALLLDEKNPDASFKVKNLTVPENSHAWENPRIALEVKAKKIPTWTCSGKELYSQRNLSDFKWKTRKWVAPDLPEKPFSVSETTETIQLVPYGNTLLRMTYLPFVSSDKNTIAYWRFEEGSNGVQHAADGDDWYRDSTINNNHMSTWSDDSRPVATNDVPFNIVPQTGETNTLALYFGDWNAAISTATNSVRKMIDYYNFTNGWSFEASVKVFNKNGTDGNWPCILGKDGKVFGDYPPFYLKVVSSSNAFFQSLVVDDDTNDIYWFDGREPFGSGITIIETGKWYNIAVTYDISTSNAELYIKGENDEDYYLEASRTVPGSVSLKWNEPWAIGRSFHWDRPVGYMNGIIDEVRVSDRPLLPEEFLASQIPEPGIIWIMTVFGALLCRRNMLLH